MNHDYRCTTCRSLIPWNAKEICRVGEEVYCTVQCMWDDTLPDVTEDGLDLMAYLCNQDEERNHLLWEEAVKIKKLLPEQYSEHEGWWVNKYRYLEDAIYVFVDEQIFHKEMIPEQREKHLNNHMPWTQGEMRFYPHNC